MMMFQAAGSCAKQSSDADSGAHTATSIKQKFIGTKVASFSFVSGPD